MNFELDISYLKSALEVNARFASDTVIGCLGDEKTGRWHRSLVLFKLQQLERCPDGLSKDVHALRLHKETS